jgi:hypothetical protein
MRGRNRNGRGPNPLQRSYESNGPDVKVRGTAQHIAEKYAQLARDAQASGDPVMAENYFQHAEHYWRIVLAAQEQMTQQYGHQFQPARPFGEEGEDGDEDGDDDGSPYPMGADQPIGPGNMGPGNAGQGYGRDDDQPYQQDNRGQQGQNRDSQNRNDNRGDRNNGNRNDRNARRFDRNDRSGQDRGDRNNPDRQGNDRQNQDRQGGDRQSQDRSGQDRSGQDRSGNDRQYGDRQNSERQNGERQGGERQGGERPARERFERPRRESQPRDDQADQPRMDDGERQERTPERAQQAEVQGRQPRPVIDADEAAIGLPSFVTAPRRKTVEIDAGDDAPATDASEPAAPRRRGRPPGARNKPKAEAGAE